MPQKTYVYIMKDCQWDHVQEFKIGISINLESRESNALTWRNMKQVYAKEFPNRAKAKEVEDRLQKYFQAKGKHLHGEFFRLMPWDVAYAKAFIATGGAYVPEGIVNLGWLFNRRELPQVSIK